MDTMRVEVAMLPEELGSVLSLGVLASHQLLSLTSTLIIRMLRLDSVDWHSLVWVAPDRVRIQVSPPHNPMADVTDLCSHYRLAMEQTTLAQ